MAEEMQVVPMSIEGTMPSADGKYILVKTKSGDTEPVLAFDVAQAFTLLSGIASAAEKCREVQGLPAAATYSMTVKEWSLSLVEGGQMIVSFTVLGGTLLSFGIDTSQIPVMREALQAMETALAGAAPASP